MTLVALGGCGDDYDDQVARFEKQVSDNRLGDASDVWLEKTSMFGGWDRVSLFFGYMDDYSACAEVAEILSQKYGYKYRCVPAN